MSSTPTGGTYRVVDGGITSDPISFEALPDGVSTPRSEAEPLDSFNYLALEIVLDGILHRHRQIALLERPVGTRAWERVYNG